MVQSLTEIIGKKIAQQIFDEDITIETIYFLNRPCQYIIQNFLNELYFNKWQYHIRHSLVEIESKEWLDVEILYEKYYEDGDRNYYMDVTYITNDQPEWINAPIIKQYQHPYWEIYLAKAQRLAYEDERDLYDDEDNEGFEEDYDY